MSEENENTTEASQGNLPLIDFPSDRPDIVSAFKHINSTIERYNAVENTSESALISVSAQARKGITHLKRVWSKGGALSGAQNALSPNVTDVLFEAEQIMEDIHENCTSYLMSLQEPSKGYEEAMELVERKLAGENLSNDELELGIKASETAKA